MHTYRKGENGGWQAGYQHALTFDPLGPAFGDECQAAALVSFLNGGRYNPYEVEELFRLDLVLKQDDDASIHPDRPKSFDNDYPLEATQRHR